MSRLFARSDRKTENEIRQRLREAEYNWGSRVTLNGPIFDGYYHVTIDHNRNEIKLSSERERESGRGLLDHYKHGLHEEFCSDITHQTFHSDAGLDIASYHHSI